MHARSYTLKNFLGNDLIFRFLSEGKETLPMIIAYETTNDPNTYNLGFGVLKEREVDGAIEYWIDDTVETKNGNMKEVIATVAQSLNKFWAIHPTKNVIIVGTSPERNTLYNRVIENYGHELEDRVRYYGQRTIGGPKEPYKPKQEYVGFYIEPLNNQEYGYFAI